MPDLPADTPTLVLLPGLDGTEVFFRPLVDALAPHLRCRVIDYPTALCSYDELQPFVESAVADLPEFLLLGSSFSGPLAVRLAHAHSGRVKGLVMAASFLGAPRPAMVPWRFALSTPVVCTVRAARRVPIWLRPEGREGFAKAKAEVWDRVDASTLARRLRAVADVDVRASFEALRTPLLVVTFDGDEAVPARNAEEMTTLQPSSQRVRLPGRHLAMAHDPHPFAAALRAFIAATR